MNDRMRKCFVPDDGQKPNQIGIKTVLIDGRSYQVRVFELAREPEVLKPFHHKSKNFTALAFITGFMTKRKSSRKRLSLNLP